MGHSDLPLASGEKHARALARCGWTRVTGRRGRGSHFLLVKDGHPAALSIPDHREVKRALLAAQLRTAGISHDTYLPKCKP